MTYSDKLKDPRWQKRRLLIFERDNWTCKSCNRKDLPLHIHHLKYLTNAAPWEYPEECLITYCEICHETEHLIGEQIHQGLLELIEVNSIFIKPVSQLCILIEEFPPFYEDLKTFLNDQMITHLKLKSSGKAVLPT